LSSQAQGEESTVKHVRVAAFWLAAAAFVGLPGCGKRELAPDEALRQVAKGLVDNKPKVLWGALPLIYQEDLSALVHEFGTKMDTEVWAKAFQVARKACHVLKAKKQFLWANPMLASFAGGKAAEMEATWDPAVDCVITLLDSELSDAAKLKTLDLGAFLAGTGATFMKQVSAVSTAAPGDPFNAKTRELADAKLTVLKLEDDEATVRVEVPGRKAENVRMIRIEGKWVVREVAERWQDAMAKAKEALAEVSPQNMAQRKPSIMKQMAEAEKMIDTLASAKTAEEFNAMIVPLVFRAMGAMAKRSGGARTMPGGGTPKAPGAR